MRNDSDRDCSLNHSDLRFIRIKNFVRIHSDWKSWIEFWLGLKKLGLTRVSSDWPGYRFRNESE